MPAGFIAFPGVITPRHLTVTRTHGCRADINLLDIVPQSSTPDTSGESTLTFNFNGITVSMFNCLCDRGTMQITPDRQYEILEIQDRRWFWRRCYYTNAFNVRYPDGTIDTSTQATIQEIAFFLLQAMGESVFDVSNISSTELPEIVYDHDNCADALEQLLYPRGYVVTLSIFDQVVIYERNQGTALPNNDDVVSVQVALDPPTPPAQLIVCGDKTLVQSKLLCMPVGVDLDGTVKPVDDLRFKPAGGWAGTDLIQFSGLASQAAKDLALRYVGKLYQAVSQADGTFNLQGGSVNYCPGEITVSTAFQYLPLYNELLTTYTDFFGKVQREFAYVEGTFYNGTPQANPPQGANTAAYTRVDRRDWKLIGEPGLLLFNNPALKAAGPRIGPFTFAEVYLTCTYAIHALTIQAKDRFTAGYSLGGIGTDQYKVDSMQRQLIAKYIPASASVSSITDNLSAVQTDAQNFLNVAINKYQTQQGTLLLYRGIYPISTDGINLQIKWNVGVEGIPAPFGTLVAQNFDGIPDLPRGIEQKDKRLIRMTANPTNRRNRNFRSQRGQGP